MNVCVCVCVCVFVCVSAEESLVTLSPLLEVAPDSKPLPEAPPTVTTATAEHFIMPETSASEAPPTSPQQGKDTGE